MRRALTLALVLATASLALVVPREARAQHELRVWHAYHGQEETALVEAARAFERSLPGTRVILVAQPFGSYASKLSSAIPSGNGPDVFIDSHDRVGGYHRAGLLAEIALDPFAGRIAPEHLGAFRVEGAAFGVPLSLKCAALYVNTGLVEGPVETLEEIERLSLPDGIYPLAMEGESAYWTASLFAAYGRPLLTEDGGWGLTGAPAERALTHLLHLLQNGAVPEESSGGLVTRLFAGGRAGTAINGPWMASDLPDSLPYRIQPLPRVEGADGQPMRPYVTVEGAYVSAEAREPAAAAAFARFLALGEGALIRARSGRQVVTDQEAWGALEGDAFLASFRAAAEGGLITPTHENMSDVYVPADRAIRKVLRGMMQPAEALEEGSRRFANLTRPLPEPADSRWGLAVLGLLMLVGVLWMLHRLRDPDMRVAIRRSLPAYRYVAHAAVAVGLLVILPLAVGAATSFFAGRGTDMYFVGIANYVDILTARGADLLGNGSFWLVLVVTVLWTVSNVLLHVVIGVFLALLLHRPYLKMKGLYRVLLILPWAVPNYVTALAWKGMFHRQFGAVNAILTSCGAEPVSWFSHWVTAFGANVATNVWLGFPFMMVVTLGALTAIPKDLYEAAAVDGANAWQRFWKITLPLLGPFLAPAVAMGSVWTFNMFNVVYLVSGGEPDGGTEILVSEAYRWAFTRGNQYGYAAAYAVLIFIILAISTSFSARLAEARR